MNNLKSVFKEKICKTAITVNLQLNNDIMNTVSEYFKNKDHIKLSDKPL